MKKIPLLALLICLFFIKDRAYCQVNLSNSGTGNVYTQNFNTLASTGSPSWTNNTSIVGWYLSPAAYTVGTGSATAGAIYSFGSTGAADRALGSVASGGTNVIYYGVRIRNNGATNITKLTIGYTGEQWRYSGTATAQALTLQYLTTPAASVTSVTGGTYTTESNLTFTSPIISGSARALDGNAAANRIVLASYTITLANAIQPNQEIFVRWEDLDNTGSDHGLAIDDISVTGLFLPQVTMAASTTACSGVTANISATVSTNTGSAPTGYQWQRSTTGSGGTFSNITGATDGGIYGSSGTVATLSFTPTIALQGYAYKLIVTNAAGSTTSSATTLAIPTVNTVSDITVCAGVSASASFSGTGTAYAWTNNNTSIGLGASGSGNISSFTTTNSGASDITGTITVTPNGCSSAATSFDIIVKPKPTVNTISDQNVCNGDATADVIFSGSIGGAVYNWTNNLTSIGIGASGSGDILSFVPVNAGASAANATITVTPTFNSCNGIAQTFHFVVNPVITADAVTDKTFCNNAAASVSFSGSTTGATYNWMNDNTAIGLGASGSGNLSFTATNSGVTPIVANINVTPSINGCSGTPVSFTITVDPSPGANAIGDQVICNGANTSAISFSGSAVSGTTYSWTNNTTSIGLAAAGTGDISTFSAVNNGTSDVASTISVTPVANSCSGAAKNFTITVHPTPTVNTVSNQSRCNGAGTAAINFSGPVSNTTYAWDNDNTDIGLGANGSGNISSFTATNNGASLILGTITVTPTANSCVGIPFLFDITVKPTPTVNNVSSQTLCNGTSTSAITFSGAVGSTIYNWTNNNTAIGLGASSSGTINSFTATNNGSSNIMGTITVTPVANSCTGSAGNFDITVKPTPSVNTISNQSVCDGANTSLVTPTGSAVSGTTYNWVNNTPAIGLGASGNGDIASFTAINAGTSAVVATVSVTPIANSCSGSTKDFTITANPIPTVDAVSNQTKCTGQNTAAINFTGAVSGTVYNWTNNLNTIGLVSSGSGNIPAFATINNGSAPVTATVLATPTANSCNGTATSFDITVNYLPAIIASNNAPINTPICENTTLNLTSTPSGGSGVYSSYTWSGPNSYSSNTQNPAINNIPIAGEGTYNVTVTDNNGCTSVAGTTVVDLNISGTWIGGASGSWSTGTNWCGGVPVASSPIIPAGTVVTITTTPGSVTNLTVGNGSTIDIAASQSLVITGDVTLNNTAVTGEGKVLLQGSATQMIATTGTTTIHHLELDNTNGATITNGSLLNVTGSVNILHGTINTNGGLRLKSNLNETAWMTGLNSGGYINGNVAVERYVPGGYGTRAYRFIGHPFASGVALNVLTDNIDITGAGGAGNGFTSTNTNNASAFYYDFNASNSANSWKAFTSANTASWNPYQGIRVLVRGSKGEGISNPYITPSSVVMDMAGNLNQGTVTVPLTLGTYSGFNFIGNPYPAPVYAGQALNSSVNVGSIYWTWNPGVPGNGIQGAYVPLTVGGTDVLPQYSAFFVEVSANTSVTFNESDKVTSATGNNSYFKTTGLSNLVQIDVTDSNNVYYDRLYLKSDSNSIDIKEDGIDGKKLANTDMNFFVLSADSVKLSYDARRYEDNKTIPLGIQAQTKKAFVFKVKQYGLPANMQLFLNDKYLNVVTPLTDTTHYSFAITADTLSQGMNRFEINMKVTTPPPAPLTAGSSLLDSNNSSLQMSVYPNPANDILHLKLPITMHNAGMQIINMNGQAMYKTIVNAARNTDIQVDIKNLPDGLYLIQLNKGKERFIQRFVKQEYK